MKYHSCTRRIVAGLIAAVAVATSVAGASPQEVANRTLLRAGLPPIPRDAKDVQCYAWSGLSAGLYATFRLADARKFLASFPADVARHSPIPREYLAPPNSSAPWFGPGAIRSGAVLWRGRIVNGAPEIFRLYLDDESDRIFLYYSWNNKRTYP